MRILGVKGHLRVVSWMTKPTEAAGDRKTGNARIPAHELELYTYSIEELVCVDSAGAMDLYALIAPSALGFSDSA